MARKLSEALNGVQLKNADADSLASVLTTQQAAPRTDEQLRAEAERSVGSLYNQKTLAAQQQYDRTALGLRNQLDAISAVYAQQRDNAAANTRQSISALDRRAMSRGMGRSSYNMATLGNMQTEGDKIQNQIATNETNTRADIESRIQQGNQQLAELLGSYHVDREMDILGRMDTQRDKDAALARQDVEYNNSLIMGLADRMRQQQEIEFNQGMATKQFEAGRSDAAFNQGITREQLDADLAQMLFSQQMSRDQFDMNKAQVAFQQDMATKGFDADRADAAFQQALAQRQFDAGRADAAFQQDLATRKLDADLSNMLFNQTMSQKEFDARLDQVAFDQGITREQLDLNIKKVLFDIDMAQKEWDRRYGGLRGRVVSSGGASGGGRGTGDKTNDIPISATYYDPVSTAPRTVTGATTAEARARAMAAYINNGNAYIQSQYNNERYRTPPPQGTTSTTGGIRYTDPYTNQSPLPAPSPYTRLVTGTGQTALPIPPTTGTTTPVSPARASGNSTTTSKTSGSTLLKRLTMLDR